LILLILGINIFKPLKGFFSLLSESNGGEGLMEKGAGFFEKLSKKSLLLGAFFLGILFAIGWVPCAVSLVLPVLILVLFQKTSLLTGGVLLFIFGLGHGIPIIPLTMFTKGARARIGNAYISLGKVVEKLFGVAVIVLALLFIL